MAGSPALLAAVGTSIASVASDADATTPPRVAVAFSGGVDSTVLLHTVARLHHDGRVAAVALHIHHGLQPAADEWLAHCRDVAAALGIPFDSEHVTVARTAASVEGEARRVRYAALARLCREHGCRILMTAHHADDQAETVLLNLARGAGIAGLAATARKRQIDELAVLRPFIDIPGATMRETAAAERLAHIEDASNQDRRYTRNAIRHEVMPPLRRIAPTIATHLARVATHASTLQSLLDEIGAEDIQDDDAEADLDVDRLAALSPPRAANALRVWLARRGMRAPSSVVLAEMLDQLLHATPDAQIALLHERKTLRLYRGRIAIDTGGPPRASYEAIAWDGEARIDVPAWHGSLLIARTAGRGIDAASLREHGLVLRERRGGERMRQRVDGPSRTLKNLYQEAGIPAWRRERLPLVYCGERLVHVAGLGMNAAALVEASPGVELVDIAWAEHAADAPSAHLP